MHHRPLGHSLPTTLLLAAGLAAQALPHPDDERVARLYDLGPVLQLLGATTPAAAPFGRALRPEPTPLAALAQLVGDFVQPALRADEHIGPLGERWFATVARPEQHAWIDRFLAAAQQTHAAQVQVRCQVFSLSEVTWLRQVAPQLPAAGAAPGQPTILSAGKATDAFRAALAEVEDLTELAAPSLVTQALASASIAATTETAFVRDFDVEIAQGQVLASPLVDVVLHGVTLDGTVLPLGDGRIGISLHLVAGELLQPIATYTTKLGGTADITIQLPEVVQSQLRTAIALRGDETAVLTLPPTAGKRRFATIQLQAIATASPR